MITNEVQHTCRSHHKTMSLSGCFQCSLPVSLPAKDNGTIGNLGICQFIPAHNFTPFALHIIAHTRHEVALQVLFILQSFFLHTRLTQRAHFPMGFTGFVTTQMNVFGRKQRNYLINYILQKSKDTVIAGTVNDIRMISSQSGKHTDEFIHYRTSQQRISSQRCIAVCRHLYFGNHLYPACSRISNNLTNIILSIEALFYCRFTLTLVTAFGEKFTRALHPACSYFCQQRIFLYLDTPAIIIHQMQMQRIQFQHSHAVNDTKQILLGDEKAGNIHHQSAIPEPRLIGNGHCRHYPFRTIHFDRTFYCRRQ